MAKRCAIIGAGPAGCAAAYELQKAGFDVTLFEASAQVGGRTQTWREQNLTHDSGAGFFTNFYPNLKTYIDEL
ncbi:MAG: FAD-dependent oxidoreductase, partial [Myxococcota bacterium]|nr:FAD-dependent oxidoreductase [Myxococcota bacterium]